MTHHERGRQKVANLRRIAAVGAGIEDRDLWLSEEEAKERLRSGDVDGGGPLLVFTVLVDAFFDRWVELPGCSALKVGNVTEAAAREAEALEIALATVPKGDSEEPGLDLLYANWDAYHAALDEGRVPDAVATLVRNWVLPAAVVDFLRSLTTGPGDPS